MPNIPAILIEPVKIYPNNIQYKNIKNLQENVFATDLIFLSAIKNYNLKKKAGVVSVSLYHPYINYK